MQLAIAGGQPVRTKKFPAYRFVGEEEREAVNRVIDSGVLSRYLGCWHGDFYGGPEVQALEKQWADYFGVKHAIAVNSCTSGLQAAVGAIGTEPGEEIIVTPYSMCISATAPLLYGAIPVFADIEDDCFCLDPEKVEAAITPRTRAILVVDLFGQPYDADAINAVAKRHGLYVIEDAAQAPGAKYKGRYTGTLGDVGVFSLNYHKHIHCGEGGVVVTDSDELAEKIRLIRNHAEAVVEAKGHKDLTNMLGFNFRMTEIDAAITHCQLQKLSDLIEHRRNNCDYLAQHLGEIPALAPPQTRPGAEHAYYIQVFKFDETIAGVSRDSFINAVAAELPLTELREAEGVKISNGYVKPLYLMPLFQKKIAMGSKGYPFTSPGYGGSARYDQGLCPVAEHLQEKELFSHEFMRPPATQDDMDDVVKAFWKVWELRDKL